MLEKFESIPLREFFSFRDNDRSTNWLLQNPLNSSNFLTSILGMFDFFKVDVQISVHSCGSYLGFGIAKDESTT